jgi:hypothetical protein
MKERFRFWIWTVVSISFLGTSFLDGFSRYDLKFDEFLITCFLNSNESFFKSEGANHCGRFSYKRVDKIFFRSELYFLGSNYYFFMILWDFSQFLGKILTGQNIGKNSLYDADVSSLWKNEEKKWCIIAISVLHQLFVWSLEIALRLNWHPSLFPLPSCTPRTSIVL